MEDYDELDEPLENPSCPYCSGIGVPLGTLGAKEWFRCQDCGSEFSHDKASKIKERIMDEERIAQVVAKVVKEVLADGMREDESEDAYMDRMDEERFGPIDRDKQYEHSDIRQAWLNKLELAEQEMLTDPSTPWVYTGVEYDHITGRGAWVWYAPTSVKIKRILTTYKKKNLDFGGYHPEGDELVPYVPTMMAYLTSSKGNSSNGVCIMFKDEDMLTCADNNPVVVKRFMQTVPEKDMKESGGNYWPIEKSAYIKENSMKDEELVKLIARLVKQEIEKEAAEPEGPPVPPAGKGDEGDMDIGAEAPMAPEAPEEPATLPETLDVGDSMPVDQDSGYVFGDIQSFMTDVARWAKEEKGDEALVYDVVREYADDILDWVHDEVVDKMGKSATPSAEKAKETVKEKKEEKK